VNIGYGEDKNDIIPPLSMWMLCDVLIVEQWFMFNVILRDKNKIYFKAIYIFYRICVESLFVWLMS
jgi:hypothetical protein